MAPHGSTQVQPGARCQHGGARAFPECWGRARGGEPGSAWVPSPSFWGCLHRGCVVSSSRSTLLRSREPAHEPPQLGSPARGCTRGQGSATLAVPGSQDPSLPQARGCSSSRGLRGGRKPAASCGASAKHGGAGVPGGSPSGVPRCFPISRNFQRLPPCPPSPRSPPAFQDTPNPRHTTPNPAQHPGKVSQKPAGASAATPGTSPSPSPSHGAGSPSLAPRLRCPSPAGSLLPARLVFQVSPWWRKSAAHGSGPPSPGPVRSPCLPSAAGAIAALQQPPRRGHCCPGGDCIYRGAPAPQPGPGSLQESPVSALEERGRARSWEALRARGEAGRQEPERGEQSFCRCNGEGKRGKK